MADLLIAPTAADSVEGNSDYRQGILHEAEQAGGRGVKLTIEDKETGLLTTLSTDQIPGMWGANKSYLPSDVYESFDSTPPEPMDTVGMAEALLDTRESGLRFYYFVPYATNDPRTATA